MDEEVLLVHVINELIDRVNALAHLLAAHLAAGIDTEWRTTNEDPQGS